MHFSQEKIFSYNKKRKFFAGLGLIAGVFAALLLVVYFYVNKDLFAVGILGRAISNIISHIKNSTLLGALYTTLFGGLFFLSVPLELFFIRFLNSGHSALVIVALYLIGITVSFTANYFIGAHFSHISMRIVSPRRFFKIKGFINKHGAISVYVLNVLPLASQPLSAILGVFRYNKTKFYLFFILGQLTKYTLIAIAM